MWFAVDSCSCFFFPFFLCVFQNKHIEWKPFIKQAKKKADKVVWCTEFSQNAIGTQSQQWLPLTDLKLLQIFLWTTIILLDAITDFFLWCILIVNLEIYGVSIFNHSFFSSKIKIRIQHAAVPQIILFCSTSFYYNINEMPRNLTLVSNS